MSGFRHDIQSLRVSLHPGGNFPVRIRSVIAAAWSVRLDPRGPRTANRSWIRGLRGFRRRFVLANVYLQFKFCGFLRLQLFRWRNFNRLDLRYR